MYFILLISIFLKPLLSGHRAKFTMQCWITSLKESMNSDKSIHTNKIEVGKELELRIVWLTTWNFVTA